MKSISEFPQIFLYRDRVDMRKQAIGLMTVVQESMRMDPFSGIYAFCSRRRDLLKLVYFDTSGFAMWVKKLDREKFPWPRKMETDYIEITPTQMSWLLDGFDFSKLKPHKKLEYTRFF